MFRRTTKYALKLSLQKLLGEGEGGFSPPLTGLTCSGHFERKVSNETIYNLRVADLNPMSKSNFDHFL